MLQLQKRNDIRYGNVDMTIKNLFYFGGRCEAIDYPFSQEVKLISIGAWTTEFGVKNLIESHKDKKEFQ